MKGSTFKFSFIMATMLVFLTFININPAFAINKLGWSQEQADIWAQLKAENHYLWQHLKAQADSSSIYNDDGLRDAMVYMITGDVNYAYQAYGRISYYAGRTKPGQEPSGRDETRQKFGRMAMIYHWIKDVLPAQDKANFRDILDHWVDLCLENQPPWGTRPGDSDETVGHYFGMVIYALAVEDEDPARTQEILNANPGTSTPPVGGLDATATNFSTLRNAIAAYAIKAAGGQWMESAQYNLGTVQLLIAGVESINRYLGEDKFPEITALYPQIAKAFVNELTPDFWDSFQWGDVQDPHSLLHYHRNSLMSMLGGITKDPEVSYIIWNKLYFSYYPTIGEGGVFLYADPYTPRQAPSGRTYVHGKGRGLAYYHEGWDVNDSFYGSQMLNHIGVDHEMESLNNFVLWRNNDWALTAPVGYINLEDSPFSNTLMVSGAFGRVKEARGEIAFETGDGFVYHAGTQGGAPYESTFYHPPNETVHEWTRSTLYLHHDDASDSIVVFDRVDASDPQTSMSSYLFDRYRTKEKYRILNADSKHQWILHMPEPPTKNGDTFTWNSPGGELMTLKTYMTDYTTQVIDEYAQRSSGASNPTLTGGFIEDSELAYQLRIIPNSKEEWQTFLNVIHVGGPMTTSKHVAYSGEKAEALLIEIPGIDNVLAIFNGKEGPYIAPSPMDLYGNVPHDPNKLSDISKLHYFKSGFKINLNLDSYTEVFLVDLNPTDEWTVSIDGVETPLDVTDSGMAHFFIDGNGNHDISVFSASEPDVCGNGVLEVYEECDDGNTSNGDGCSSDCLIEEESSEVCGDGVCEGSEDSASCEADCGSSSSSQSTHNIMASYNSNRANAFELSGEIEIGNVYVYVNSDTNIVSAHFYLDDPEMNGAPYHSEGWAPFDFMGGSVEVANPYDTNQLCQGTHNITVFVTHTDSSTETISADFNINGSLSICGNGVKEAEEECDDGNVIDGDGCSSECIIEEEPAVCGNGSVEELEECDDGNVIDGDGCSSECIIEEEPAVCGNGSVEELEECDDGNTSSNDGCSSACVTEYCGDYIQQASLGEECDDGNTSSNDGCSNLCKNEYCGDNVVQSSLGEECDDGNIVNGDGCSSSCTEEANNDGYYKLLLSYSSNRSNAVPLSGYVAGNVYIFISPEDNVSSVKFYLDDANMLGEPMHTEGWKPYDLAGGEVDSANPYDVSQLSEGSHNITAKITLIDGSIKIASANFMVENNNVCGDGSVEDLEECDDGNIVDGDGCSSTCLIEIEPAVCGNGSVEDIEECDDGNASSNDGCSASCVTEYCGDGIQQASLGEECDDGNTSSNDGCSASCVTEYCGDGIQQASLGEECDDGNTSSNDGCSASCVTEYCGDGIQQASLGEECDDGNTISNDGCSASCVTEYCGDGIEQSSLGEECDDGNTISNDGCSAACLEEANNDGYYKLMVSLSSTRSNAVPLSGDLSGNIYVFIGPENNVGQVSFYLDDPSMLGSPAQTEGYAPYDFAGTAGDQTAWPFNTQQLAIGSHNITAKITLLDGSTEIVSADFNVEEIEIPVVSYWIETENPQYIDRTILIANDSDASGSKYIYAPNKSGNYFDPSSAIYATYTVNISESGEYIMWGRVIAPTGSSDSFFIQIDDGVNNLWDVSKGSDWHWDKVSNRGVSDPSKFYLSAGTHTIKIKIREDGTKIDKMLLIKDMAYTPSGHGL